MISLRCCCFLATSLAVSALGPSLAQAKLGETQAETILRYGQRVKRPVVVSPLLAGAPEHEYPYKGWLIRVAFVEGRAARQSFQKYGSGSGAIRDFELTAIFEPEGGAAAWQPVRSNDAMSVALPTLSGQRWRRASDGATASLAYPGHVLVIESPAAAEFEQKRKDEREEAAKKTVPKF